MDVKACPYCGEEILAVATKCKHCQSMLGTGPVSGTGSVPVSGSQDRRLATPVRRLGACLLTS